jgi:hypothetical protein
MAFASSSPSTPVSRAASSTTVGLMCRCDRPKSWRKRSRRRSTTLTPCARRSRSTACFRCRRVCPCLRGGSLIQSSAPGSTDCCPRPPRCGSCQATRASAPAYRTVHPQRPMVRRHLLEWHRIVEFHATGVVVSRRMAALKMSLVILTTFAGLSFKIGKPQADNMQGLSAGGFC